VFLPQGLLYTAVLSPVFIYFLYKHGSLKNMALYFLLIILPLPFQLYQGVDTAAYLRSTVLMITAWIFLFTAIKTIKILHDDLGLVFRKILVINSLLLILALLILPFGSLRPMMWYSIPISPNIASFPRLDMFSYEPSHYGLLLTPVFLYFILRAMGGKLKHPYLYVIATILPLILSLSFGVMAAFTLAAVTTIIIYRKHFPHKQLSSWSYGGIGVIAIFLLIVMVWPDNAVWQRIINIFAGSDTSARGRLFNSFMFAGDLIAQHNPIFGVGPGQVKVLAHDLIINYYQYTGDFAEVVRIPNSMGEMLAVYGIYGFILKIFFEIFFFIKTRVYKNIYALALFIFIFIYQFTGSFLVNVAELGIWALVFHFRPSVTIFTKHEEVSP
jgi:hypothetical protein